MKKKTLYLCMTVLTVLMFGLTACGGKGNGSEQSVKNVPVADLKAAVVAELGDDYWPEAEIPADALEMGYGLTSDMYEEYVGDMPMMSAKVDTMIIVKAKEGKADAVEEALTAYHKALKEDTMQYPMNIGKIQASKVERIGNYVCFVLLGGDVTSVEEQGEEAVIKYCQEQNDRAIKAISDKLK